MLCDPVNTLGLVVVGGVLLRWITGCIGPGSGPVRAPFLMEICCDIVLLAGLVTTVGDFVA